MKKMIVLPLFLAVVCLISGLVLSYVNGLTAPIIEERERASSGDALVAAFPDVPSEEVVLVGDDAANGILEIYQAADQGYIYKLSQKGYGGDIIYYVAFDTDGTIVYYSVIDQSETKGLGDKVTGEEFIASVVGKAMGDSIDLISGSTVSSKAVSKGIDLARENFLANYQ